jgi:hypothetical protein
MWTPGCSIARTGEATEIPLPAHTTGNQQTMQGQLSKILEEHLWRPIDYPDGFKPNLRLDSNSVKRYNGSSKFLNLENWVSAVVFRYAL